MIQKISKLIIKLKPVILKLLEKIEHLEKDYISKTKIKVYKEKFHIPEWILIVTFLFILVVILFLTQPFLKSTLFVIMLKTFSTIVFIYLFWVSIKYFIKRIKLPYININEYKKDIVLFWSIALLNLVLIAVFKLNSDFSFYVIPIFGFVLLTTLLMNDIWGGLYAILLSTITTGIFCWSFECFIFFILSSLNVIRWAKNIQSRKDIATIIVKSTLINIFIAVVTRFNISSDFAITDPSIKILIYNVLGGGVFSWIIVIVLLAPMETIYNRTTSIKLVELSNFNHPLLKRLITETPGTYHHSIIVSSLAENVATELQANSLLCKVAGYYHDIGKLIKPEYFIENQVAMVNPHTEINPSLSALIIISHVKEGVKLAEEHNIDKAIIDIINQHHGNSVIHGLYEKTLELGIDSGENKRYPGPKPQTKESAILMITDSCEAACRSIKELDIQKIKETVEHVINSKFIEGQFDESPLTLRDLHKIANIITQMLTSFYHLRTYQLQDK